jgi:hypothetical protein
MLISFPFLEDSVAFRQDHIGGDTYRLMLFEMPLGEHPQAVSAQLFWLRVFFVIHPL